MSGSSEGIGGKRLVWEWDKVIGEECLGIELVGVVPHTTLVVCTFRAFYGLKESGGLKFVKRFDYSPSCFTSYTVGASVFICVCSDRKSLFVYQDAQLKWASHLNISPVSISRSSFVGIDGALVLLSSLGTLHVVYLGTDPSLFASPPVESREIDYEETDRELQALHRIIKSSSKDSSAVLKTRKDLEQISVTATVESQMNRWSGETEVMDPEYPIPSCSVTVKVSAKTPTHGVRVAINVVKPLMVNKSVVMLRTVSDFTEFTVEFYMASYVCLFDLTANIVTSFTNSKGAPRILQTEVQLPLRLVMKCAQPNKEATHKLTLSSNKPVVNLPELFPEFGYEASMATGIGLQFFGGELVTILSSRTTHRYRLQADKVSGLYPVLVDLFRRLQTHWSAQGDGDKFTITASSALPLTELYSLVDSHVSLANRFALLNVSDYLL